MDEEDKLSVADATVFLNKTSNNSKRLKDSLKTVKNYTQEWDKSSQMNLQSNFSRRCEQYKQNSLSITSQCIFSQYHIKKQLKSWGLPLQITRNYEKRGITNMFDWQIKCISNSSVLMDYGNLLYSAPTSAGKTLVAELLAVKNVLERQKKVLIILPFVSVVREKMFYFQEIFSSSGIRTEGFMGSHAPPGGFQNVHIAICTIEKANSLVNKLMDDGNISDLGAVIVDELHLLGDHSRGYILELLLTKIKYLSNKYAEVKIQIIGMSATLPNLNLLAKWLQANLYITDFRPIPLEEHCLVNNSIFDKNMKLIRKIKPYDNLQESDAVLQICLETIEEGCSVLIFCTTKNWCEKLAQLIASQFFKLGSANTHSGNILRNQLKSEGICEVLEQLKNSPVGLDSILRSTVSFGVAYHHAGLTFDERDIIEGAFKNGSIRVLVATSTLSSGVNLPARRVIIRSPVFLKQSINILTYKQMIGRAGRMGKDTMGESILICSESERSVGCSLMSSDLEPVRSCLEGGDKFMRAILEVIASGVASTLEELKLYTNCTLLYNQVDSVSPNNSSEHTLEGTLKDLIEYELVRVQATDELVKLYVATLLGKACLASSMAPNDGLSLFCELQRARQCLVLETDLHLIYLVTPYSVSSQWVNMDWMHLLNLWENLPRAMRKVGELVGLQESYIYQCVRGTAKLNSRQNKADIHKRFYTALALQDLVNEVPLSEVATKFNCCRGMLQSLQQSAATFAGMVTAFCRELGWKNMELLISQFQDRLHFGIQSELLDLMKLNSLNGLRARSLFNAGIDTICSLASANINTIENALLSAVPFQREKGLEDEDINDVVKRNKIKNIWITGHCGMTVKQAAISLVNEARTYLQLEMGVKDIKWATISDESLSDSQNIIEDNLECSLSKTKSHPENNESLKCSRKSSQMNELSNEIQMTDNNWETLDLNEMREKSYFLLELQKSDISTPLGSPKNINITNDEIKTIKTILNKTKDSSIFLSDCENRSPSLFDESLSINSQLSKIIDEKCQSMLLRNVLQNNSSSLEGLFTSGFEDEEDFKLVYDENKPLSKSSDESTESNEEIASSQETRFFQQSLITPKKHGTKRKLKDPRGKNKIKSKHKFWHTYTSNNLLNVVIPKIVGRTRSKSHLEKDINVQCILVKPEDVKDFSEYIINSNELSIQLHLEKNEIKKFNIGCEVIKSNKNNFKADDACYKHYKGFSVKGIGFSIGEDLIFYLEEQYFKMALHRILLKRDCTIYISSYVHAFHHLNLFNINFPFSKCLDIGIVEWLIDSDATNTTVTYLAKKYLKVDIEILSSQNAHVKWYDCKFNEWYHSCIKSWATWNIIKKQTNILHQSHIDYENVLKNEMHVSRILAESENVGIYVDKKLTVKMLNDVKRAQEILQLKAYKIAGHVFNFNSSNSVAKVLGMYHGRKVSTKKSVLAVHTSPLASIVIYWRKLNSILTKTLYPLSSALTLQSDQDRLNVSYVTHTCTGRVSMHEPNLQNVPRNFTIPASYLNITDTDCLHFQCRNIFMAKPGCVLVSADYCQLEMRILTHMCRDVTLTGIMKSDIDVFTAIAATWNTIDSETVDDDLRQKAKQLCYGIIYGMGNRTLSQQLDVTELEAAQFMDTFHSTYPSIKKFTQNVIDDCKKDGFIETLMKRRRYLPNINSKDSSERSAAERQAVNTIIQGTAADIAKNAMIKVHNTLCDNKAEHKVNLILQMHDELIYEVDEGFMKFFVIILKHSMEQSVSLTVPLPVKIRTGLRWGDLVEYKTDKIK